MTTTTTDPAAIARAYIEALAAPVIDYFQDA
jgi:hypothetical protein